MTWHSHRHSRGKGQPQSLATDDDRLQKPQERLHMDHAVEFLDPNSEMIALATGSNTRNVLVIALEIRGPLNEELAKVAVAKAVKAFPQLQSCLRETRTNLRHRLYWHPRPDLEFPVTLSDLKTYEMSTPLLEAVLNRLAPSLDRDWDLRKELPGELHLFRVSTDFHVVALVVHHAAFDGASSSELGRSCVLNYKEMVEGARPDSSATKPYALSTSRKRTVTPRKRTWKDKYYTARLALMPVISRPTLPAGNGLPTEKRQYHIKRNLTVEETTRIGLTSLKKRGAFIDLLTAASSLAIERWNDRRNVKTGVVTTALTMNIRGRYEEFDHSNSVSALFFETRPEHRRDRDKLVHSISVARINQLRRQMDLMHYDNVAKMIRWASVLSFNKRQRIVHRIVQRHQFSMAITLLGVVWPEIENGKPTLDSYPTTVGDGQITEMHGIGYKLIGSTPLVLTVYSYRNRLNLVMAVSGWQLTRPEAESFMDLFMETLRC